MNKNSRRLHPSITRHLQACLAICLAVLLFAIPVAGNAQEISTSVRGTVTTPDGSPAAGQTVVITDTRTGSSRTATTSASGAFNIRGLPVGGPFTIRVQSDQYESTLVTDVYTNLSSAASFNIRLEESDTTIDEIVVTSAMVSTIDLAVGPGSSFSLEEIQDLPSISRQKGSGSSTSSRGKAKAVPESPLCTRSLWLEPLSNWWSRHDPRI